MKDKEMKALVAREAKRQKSVINLIASENAVSKDVLEVLGTELVNKYAEGYPGKRYYGGNTVIDEVERLTQLRALKAFRLSAKKWGVNVQALSGSPANLAVLFALVPQGEKIMGLSLSSGGHLTHGHKVSITGTHWKQVPFTVDGKTGRLDYDAIEKIAVAEKPKLIIAGFTAYPRVVDWKKFRAIADKVGAYLLVDMSHVAGLVAGKAYPSPFPYADIVTTTTHKTLRGPRGALIFSKIDERDLPAKINKAVFPGLQGGPHMNQVGAIAVALFEASQPAFEKYAKQVVKNAKVLGEELKELGWNVITGGTDSHLLLLDTWNNGEGVSGGVASDALEANGIIVNKNAIPGDQRPPMDPSGIRLGTANETTRGKKEKDMIKLARKINEVLLDAIMQSK